MRENYTNTLLIDALDVIVCNLLHSIACSLVVKNGSLNSTVKIKMPPIMVF
jgi:hypothetical protein